GGAKPTLHDPLRTGLQRLSGFGLDKLEVVERRRIEDVANRGEIVLAANHLDLLVSVGLTDNAGQVNVVSKTPGPPGGILHLTSSTSYIFRDKFPEVFEERIIFLFAACHKDRVPLPTGWLDVDQRDLGA